MGCEHIGVICLTAYTPVAFAGYAVHTRNYLSCGVVCTYGVCDNAGPCLCRFVRVNLTHAVTFVTQIPGINCGLILYSADKALYIFKLKHQRCGVGKQIFSVKCGRNKQSSAHPARKYSHNEFHAVFFGNITKPFKS